MGQEVEIVDPEHYSRASNIASAALLIVGQLLLTLVGVVLNITQTLNVDGCSPERNCDFTLMSAAGIVPLVVAVLLVLASFVTTAISVAERRRAWVFPLIGVGVVLLLIPVCFVLIGFATRLH